MDDQTTMKKEVRRRSSAEEKRKLRIAMKMKTRWKRNRRAEPQRGAMTERTRRHSWRPIRRGGSETEETRGMKNSKARKNETCVNVERRSTQFNSGRSQGNSFESL